MPTLPELYAARATVAYAAECLARGTPLPGQHLQDAEARKKTVAYYDDVQAQILALSREYAATWQRPRALPTLDWCSVCGTNERPNVPGQNVCAVCEACTTQPDTHCMVHGTAECRLCATEGEQL